MAADWMRLPARQTRVAVYGALAVGLYTAENLIPSPLPWLRLGVSNVAILLALEELGARGALAVFLLKLVLGTMLVGRFLSPFFWFAAAGGGAGLAAMVLARLALGRLLSVVGLSVVGSAVHNVVQLAVARLVLIPSGSTWLLLPVLVGTGVASGVLVGLAARAVRVRLERPA